MSDSAILAAWERRVAAYNVINGGELRGSVCTAAPYWAIVDECGKLIHSTVAQTARGIEIQIWTALHNSSAYNKSEEQAILSMDLDYVSKHAENFDWDTRTMVAAIRSLRAMEGR